MVGKTLALQTRQSDSRDKPVRHGQLPVTPELRRQGQGSLGQRGQLDQQESGTPGSVRAAALTNKVWRDRGGHTMSTSGLSVHAYTHAGSTHTHVPAHGQISHSNAHTQKNM